MNKDQVKLEAELPLMPIRDVVMFPNMIIPFFVGREESIRSINFALQHTHRVIICAAQKDIANDKPSPEDIYSIGTACLIVRTKNVPDGRVKILVQGLGKVRITEFVSSNPYVVKYERIDDPVTEESPESKAIVQLVKDNITQLIDLGKFITAEAPAILEESDPSKLADLLAVNLSLKVPDSYSLLEESSSTKRLDMINKHLVAEIEIHKIQQKIKNNTKEEMTRNQREYYLREQLQSIRKELGETEDKEGYIKKIKDAKMPPEAEKEAMKQAKRLDTLSPDSSESGLIKHYLDWMVEIPWSVTTNDNTEIGHSREVLDEDHFGLEDVKERILEFLSVRKLKTDSKGPILCLVGPPGVGKTSICRSIAKSLGRKYVRSSLGGVRDEAEIRGHRRTYIGSMPGKIIQSLKQATSRNPVFVLDEIDKLGRDFRGDPSSALLEVLDPEQNKEFKDHYLNVPFDVSQVFWIATANSLDTIPGPLLDRMEVIKVSGYTDKEKQEICKQYLLPKQQKENGLEDRTIKFTDAAIQKIIRGYTRENGLRNLERLISKVYRKIALKVAEGGEKGDFLIDHKDVTAYLGSVKYLDDDLAAKDLVGVVTGLAWTSVGGETLEMEAIKVPDTTLNLKVTGQLGSVMKESSEISFSVVKSKSKELGIDMKKHANTSIHVHALDGAVPKDGPSAGITMATVIASVLSDKPVRRDVAMTGELSLTGRVMVIGGLKEKLIAASRKGCKKVLIPKDNLKDLEDVPKEVIGSLEVIGVSDVNEVFKHALVSAETKKPKSKSKDKR
jgi:ATP-dependent Lon protease